MSGQSRFPVGFSLLVNIVLFVVPCGLFNSIKAAIGAQRLGLPIRISIKNGLIRAIMTHLTPRQIQYLLPSSIETYQAWTASAGKLPQVDTLSDGATRLLWLEKGCSKVLLFFHGGGYVMPLSSGHLDWMANVKAKAFDSGIQLSICILEYDLVPGRPYPRQMTQAILALKHILNSGYSPSDIIFGGDSAGGHLSLSLLAHLHRPRPGGIDSQISLTCPIRGCFLVSPLASFNLNTSSYNKTFSIDLLDKNLVRKRGDCLINHSPWHQEVSAGNGWGMALDVPEEWWMGLDAVDQILVTAGQQEVFRDHAVQLIDMLSRQSMAEVEGFITSGETHDGPLMDFIAGRGSSDSTDRVSGWIIGCLSG